MSGSIAVISHRFHTFSAFGVVLIALVSQRLSERPASREHTFGWGRAAEIIGALFNGVFLVVMAGLSGEEQAGDIDITRKRA